MNAVTPNQSFLMKGMQTKLAACLSAFIYDVRGNYIATAAGVWHNPLAVLLSPAGWRVADMTFHFKPGDWNTRVKFSASRWDPDNSRLVYGTKKVMENVEVTDDGKTKIVRNDTRGDLHVAYEEAASLTNSFSMGVTNGVTLDVTRSHESSTTEDASVDVSETVKGSYAGIEAEESVAAHFGVSATQTDSESVSEGKSSEIAKEKGEEGTTEESVAIEFDAKGRTHYLVTIVKEHERTQQPFDIRGIMDFDIELTMPKNTGARPGETVGNFCPHSVVMLRGVGALEQFMHGYDTDYPEMEGYWDKASVRARNGINRVISPDMRLIQASGIAYASLESNVDYRVEELGSSIPDALAHLPQVNAEDVAGE